MKLCVAKNKRREESERMLVEEEVEEGGMGACLRLPSVRLFPH